MSKKNNKKNSTRKNYKIESLEPRLMMDAAASQWLEEIDSIALSDTAVTALGDDNFYSRTNWNSKGDVTGLYLQDEESGEVESVSKADFIDAVNDKTKGSIKATDTINIIKKNLKQAVENANGGNAPSKDSDGNWLNDNVLSAQDIINAFDNGPDTAPSKRILKEIPEYDKVAAGVDTLELVGIDALKEACPHFSEWVEKLVRIF